MAIKKKTTKSKTIRDVPVRNLPASKARAVKGGVFQFKLVAVKTVSWSHDDEESAQKP